MTRPPVLVRTRAELGAVLGPGHQPGTRRAAVLTMGALHEGHLSLVRHAAQLAEVVVVTIFVNPLQFGPAEDFDRYPRDLAGDLRLLAEAGADIVFAPEVDEVYPGGPPTVRVSAGRAGERFEGAVRPGHFDGVLTVVLKLLHLVAPDVAVFGQKDAQQVMAVRRMVRDLDVPVEIVASPTVRDEDGVALSSRNAYLSATDRVRAPALWRALTAGVDAGRSGATASEVVHAAGGVLADADGVHVDYLVLLDPETADEIPADHTGPAVLAVAARLGDTRLLDNLPLEIHA